VKRLVIYLVALGLIAPAAYALDCREWDRSDEYAQEDALAEAVHTIIWSNGSSSYNVNHARIERCALRLIRDMSYEADDICAQGMRVPMSALDDMVRDYVRSCVN
jgi:hypothetical protein